MTGGLLPLAAALGAPALLVDWDDLAAGGTAYQATSEGPIYVCWPLRARGSYSTEADVAPMQRESHALVALGLTASDCASICAKWDCGESEAGLQRERADRLAQAQRVGADRARTRARDLRCLRRGEQPPGSVAIVRRYVSRSAHPLVRFPDGAGWFGEVGTPLQPWDWQRWRGPWLERPRVLAVGLSEEDCFALAREETVEGAEAVLRARGLA